MSAQQEPNAQNRQFARQVRDVYVALVAEGFSTNEAMTIIATAIAAALKGDR